MCAIYRPRTLLENLFLKVDHKDYNECTEFLIPLAHCFHVFITTSIDTLLLTKRPYFILIYLPLQFPNHTPYHMGMVFINVLFFLWKFHTCIQYILVTCTPYPPLPRSPQDLLTHCPTDLMSSLLLLLPLESSWPRTRGYGAIPQSVGSLLVATSSICRPSSAALNYQ